MLLPGSAAAGSRWRPSAAAAWQVQLQGRAETPVRADVYVLDGFDTPADVVERLHARGRRAVCYLNVGAWEEWRPDADAFPPAVLGKSLIGWPRERWLDVRRLDVLAPLVRTRMAMCRAKGFDGVDAANVDGYANPTGFRITAVAQARFNRWLARTAHELELAVGLKNDLEQARLLVRDFDFAVNESCVRLGECYLLRPFVRAGKAVLVIEYAVRPPSLCVRARRLGVRAIFKQRNLGVFRLAC